MSTEADLERKYYDAVRHLNRVQVDYIESGAVCRSGKMHYAQRCYYALRTKRIEDVRQGTLFSHMEES